MFKIGLGQMESTKQANPTPNNAVTVVFKALRTILVYTRKGKA